MSWLFSEGRPAPSVLGVRPGSSLSKTRVLFISFLHFVQMLGLFKISIFLSRGLHQFTNNVI